MFSSSEGLSSSSATDTFALDVQESEENFDLVLEIDVVPYIGGHRIPRKSSVRRRYVCAYE